MIKAGLDFSINFPGLVIELPNQYHFISFQREGTKRKDFQIGFENVYFSKFENQIEDAQNSAMTILKILQDYNVTNVNLEGYSFNSRSSSFIDLITYQTVLRYLLFVNQIEFEIFSPMTIKKTAGKGNYSKTEMFLSFLREGETNEKLFNSVFYQNILEPTVLEKVQKKNSIAKPFEDLIDGFFVLKTIKK